MDYQVGLTDEALADPRGIAEFIARQSPRMAERVGGEVLDVAESLVELPETRSAGEREVGDAKGFPLELCDLLSG